PGARAAHEVDPSVDPQRAHTSDVRPAVGLRRGQPECSSRRPRLELLDRTRPEERLRAIDVEVLLSRFSLRGDCFRGARYRTWLLRGGLLRLCLVGCGLLGHFNSGRNVARRCLVRPGARTTVSPGEGQLE